MVDPGFVPVQQTHQIPLDQASHQLTLLALELLLQGLHLLVRFLEYAGRLLEFAVQNPLRLLELTVPFP